jgi:hypothetical protein
MDRGADFPLAAASPRFDVLVPRVARDNWRYRAFAGEGSSSARVSWLRSAKIVQRQKGATPEPEPAVAHSPIKLNKVPSLGGVERTIQLEVGHRPRLTTWQSVYSPVFGS